MYIFKENMLRLYIKYIYIWYKLYEYKYIHVKTCTYFQNICLCVYLYIQNKYTQHSVTREMGSRTQMQRIDLLIIKLNKTKNKNHPEGEKQAGRQKTGAQSDMKHSRNARHMKDNGSAQDCRHKENYIGRQTRVTRETQLEPLKQWLSNKMGGDRQSTWEHMAPNKQQAMCSTDRDIWWPAWAHQQDRDITPPLRSGSQTLHTH